MEIFGDDNNEQLNMNLTPSDRSSNFTRGDIEHLKKLINKYAKVILNKRTDGMSIKQKEETWDLIAKEFNASSSTYRSVKQLRNKWEYLKKTARRKVQKNAIEIKKELIELKTKNIESQQESRLIHLKEDKIRLEMELMKTSFENDEKRKQELHELQVTKLKLEIEILSNKF